MVRTNGTSRGGGFKPPTNERGLRDLWLVYDARKDEIGAKTMAAIADEVELLRSLGTYQADVSPPETAHRLMERAMLHGDWPPYLEMINGLGAFYARAAVGFDLWPNTLVAFERIVSAMVREAYRDDGERLIECMDALRDFVMLMVLVIARAYLEERELTIAHQRAVGEFSTPVLPLKPGLLVVPVIGVVDTVRATQLSRQLLLAVRNHRARVVVLDVTGVAMMDTGVATHLVRAVDAARLLGARSVLTGLSAENAALLSQLGVQLPGLTPAKDLAEGIRVADELLAEPLSGTRLISLASA